MNNGCYATYRIFAIPRKYGQSDVSAVLALVDKPLPNGVRFNVSGDFLLEDGTPDLEYINACNKVVEAHPGILAISYTHAWRTLSPAMFAFPVNASCDTLGDVATAVALGWEATIVNAENGMTVGDKSVVTCLAETKGITCAECGLCGQSSRTRPIVSFTAHGPGKNKATAVVLALA